MSLGKIIDKKNNDLSKKIDKQRVPEHVAIIMDGNGRWATKKGLSRSYGHKQGVSVLKEILRAAKNLGCKVMTVYAFSTENWTRPMKEVDFLINLFSGVLKNEIEILDDDLILDIGPNTINTIRKVIDRSKTVLWNGPAGYFENPNFAKGSQEIARAIIKKREDRSIYSVVGGGDTISLINQINAIKDFNFVSTAGGAFLEYLEGKELPGIKALK